MEWLPPLAGVYGCSLLLATVFCLVGTALVPRQLIDEAGGSALLLGRTFPVGLSAFLASFVLLAHLLGRARLALAIVFAAAGVVIFLRRRSILEAASRRSMVVTVAASFALLVAFSGLPLILWTNWATPPSAWNHFGSIQPMPPAFVSHSSQNAYVPVSSLLSVLRNVDSAIIPGQIRRKYLLLSVKK